MIKTQLEVKSILPIEHQYWKCVEDVCHLSRALLNWLQYYNDRIAVLERGIANIKHRHANEPDVAAIYSYHLSQLTRQYRSSVQVVESIVATRLRTCRHINFTHVNEVDTALASDIFKTSSHI